MLYKKPLISLLIVSFSSFAFANDISEEELKKALAEITQVKVLDAQEPKIVSEVIVTEKEKKVEKKTKKKKFHKKKIHHKKVRDTIIDNSDINDLPEAKIYGVVDTSEPFELK